jgi:hypothetical protein
VLLWSRSSIPEKTIRRARTVATSWSDTVPVGLSTVRAHSFTSGEKYIRDRDREGQQQQAQQIDRVLQQHEQRREATQQEQQIDRVLQQHEQHREATQQAQQIDRVLQQREQRREATQLASQLNHQGQELHNVSQHENPAYATLSKAAGGSKPIAQFLAENDFQPEYAIALAEIGVMDTSHCADVTSDDLTAFMKPIEARRFLRIAGQSVAVNHQTVMTL